MNAIHDIRDLLVESIEEDTNNLMFDGERSEHINTLRSIQAFEDGFVFTTLGKKTIDIDYDVYSVSYVLEEVEIRNTGPTFMFIPHTMKDKNGICV